MSVAHVQCSNPKTLKSILNMAHSWWEIKVLGDPDLEETIFWRLDDFGCRGTVSQTKNHVSLISAYLPEERASLLDLAALSLWMRQDALCLEIAAPAVEWDLIDEQDWASSWQKYWEPTPIGDRFLVYPAWLPIPAEPDREILRLDPGVAFGTGTHATTQLCLESLEMRFSVPAQQTIVADIGCGSGILSIGALLLGASKAYAVDTDSLAVRAAIHNRHLNQISPEQMVVESGSIERTIELLDRPVDGIVCNILAEVIIDLIPKFEPIIHQKTWGILSGILLEQAKSIADTLEQQGWIVATLWKRKEWCCFNIRRS